MILVSVKVYNILLAFVNTTPYFLVIVNNTDLLYKLCKYFMYVCIYKLQTYMEMCSYIKTLFFLVIVANATILPL